MATTTFTDLSTLEAKFANELLQIQFTGTPALNRFKVMATDNMDTKHIWSSVLGSRSQDTLNEALDNSETGIDVIGSTTNNKVRYVNNYTIIIIDSEMMLVTAGAGTTTLSVTRGYGGTTAASHTTGATIWVVPLNAIGSALIGRNDGQFGSRGYNFLGNWQFEFPIINPIKKMTSFTSTKEATLAHQKEMWEPEARVNVERMFFEGTRFNNGTAAPSTADVTLTANAGPSMPGGLRYFNSIDSGRATTYTNYSRENLQAGVRYLSTLGAISNTPLKEYEGGEILCFVSRFGFDLYNQLSYPHEIYNDGKGDEFGMSMRVIKVSGFRVVLLPSDGVIDGRQFLVPNRKDVFKIIIKRWGEEQPPVPNADQHSETCTYSWTNEIRSGLLSEYASGLPTS